MSFDPVAARFDRVHRMCLNFSVSLESRWALSLPLLTWSSLCCAKEKEEKKKKKLKKSSTVKCSLLLFNSIISTADHSRVICCLSTIIYLHSTTIEWSELFCKVPNFPLCQTIRHCLLLKKERLQSPIGWCNIGDDGKHRTTVDCKQNRTKKSFSKLEIQKREEKKTLNKTSHGSQS